MQMMPLKNLNAYGRSLRKRCDPDWVDICHVLSSINIQSLRDCFLKIHPVTGKAEEFLSVAKMKTKGFAMGMF